MRRKRKTGLTVILLVIAAVMLLSDVAHGGSIDRMINLLTRPSGNSLEIRMQVEAVSVPELSEIRTEWLNRLLSHIAVRVRSCRDTEEAALEVDGKEALRFTRRESDSGMLYLFSSSPDTSYSTATPTDLLSEMSGVVPDENRTEYYSRIAVILPEFYTFFSGMTDMFQDEASVAKTNVKYKGYGVATKRWSLALDENALHSDRIHEFLRRNNLENVNDFLSGIIFSGRQRMTLLTDDEGQLMKVNYTGKAGFSSEDMRNINLEWRCMRSKTGERDEMQLTTPRVSGSGRKNLKITQEKITAEDGSQVYTCSAETDQVIGRVRTRYQLNIDIKGSEDTITGIVSEKTIVGNSTDSVSIELDLKQSEHDEYYGRLEITHVSDKIDKEHYRLKIAVRSCDEIPFRASASSLLTPESEAAIKDLMTADFLRAMISVPEHDLQYFLADLPDGFWSELIRKYEMTEEIPIP